MAILNALGKIAITLQRYPKLTGLELIATDTQNRTLPYILVGDFTIITPISFANETLKLWRNCSRSRLSTSIALSRLMRRAKSQEGEILSTHSTVFILLPLKNNTDTESSSIVKKMTEEKDLLLSEF